MGCSRWARRPECVAGAEWSASHWPCPTLDSLGMVGLPSTSAGGVARVVASNAGGATRGRGRGRSRYSAAGHTQRAARLGASAGR